MKSGAVSLALLLLSSVSAWSQRDANVALSPRGNIFTGFLVAGGGPLGLAKGYRVGSDFRVHGPLYVAFEGLQQSDHSDSSTNSITDSADLAGIMYRHQTGSSHAAVFGQVLGGAENYHNSSQSHTWEFRNAWTPALETEIGADFSLSSHWAIRPEGGYFWTIFKNNYGGAGGTSTNTMVNRGQAGIGIVYQY